MKEKITTRARVQGGKVQHNSRAELLAAVAAFEGKNITITFEEEKRKRSSGQNAYYWRLVHEITKASGYRSATEMHDLLKHELNATIFVAPNGNEMRIPQSTATLPVGEFSDYIERVKEWARDFLGLRLPEQDEVE